MFHVHVDIDGSQKRASHTLDLEFKVASSPLWWLLGIKLGSTGRAGSILKASHLPTAARGYFLTSAF